MSTRIRMMLVTDEGIYRGRRVKEKLEKRCLEYGFKIPPKEKGVVEWKRLQSMFGMFAGTRDWKMWVFREGRGIRRTRYQNLCEYYSVGAPSRFTIGRVSTAPRLHPVGEYRPRTNTIAGSVGPSATPPQTAPRQTWNWGNAMVTPSLASTTPEPQWVQYAQEIRAARVAREIAQQQQATPTQPAEPMSPGGFDAFIERRYADIIERQRARNLPDPEFPINDF